MNKIGQAVTIIADGMNVGGAPNSFLTGMGLAHLKAASEWLFTDDPCIVIGQSDFYNGRMLALESVNTGKVYVAYEYNTIPYEPENEVISYDDAMRGFNQLIEAELELRFREQFGEYGEKRPTGFDLFEWTDEQREEVYNLPYILKLRQFIEQNGEE